MSPIIIQETPEYTKLGENMLLEELDRYFGVIDRSGNELHPSKHNQLPLRCRGYYKVERTDP